MWTDPRTIEHAIAAGLILAIVFSDEIPVFRHAVYAVLLAGLLLLSEQQHHLSLMCGLLLVNVVMAGSRTKNQSKSCHRV